MPTIPEVHPGDLITAQYMNQIRAKLEDLETRVAKLESSTGSSKVTITGVTSASSPIRVGQRITVSGTNFAQPAMLNNVTVGNVTIPPNGFAFTSNDRQLVFDAPNVAGLSATGTLVTVTVTNANGSDSFQFPLFPAQEPVTGRIEASYSGAPALATIPAGQGVLFLYTARIFVNSEQIYTITPALTGAPAGWTVDFLQDTGEQPRTAPTITIPGGNGVERVLRIRVNIPAGAPIGASATLAVNAAGPAGTQILPGASSPIAITVGSPPPTPETRVRISFTGANGATLTNGRLVFSRGAAAGANFNVAVTEPRTNPTGQPPAYQVTAVVKAAGWTVNPIGGFNVPTASPQNPANNPITAVVTPPNAPSTTELVVTVTSGSDISVSYVLPVGVN